MVWDLYNLKGLYHIYIGNERVIVKSGSLSAACVKWIIYVSVRGHGSLRSRRMDAS